MDAVGGMHPQPNQQHTENPPPHAPGDSQTTDQTWAVHNANAGELVGAIHLNTTCDKTATTTRNKTKPKNVHAQPSSPTNEKNSCQSPGGPLIAPILPHGRPVVSFPAPRSPHPQPFQKFS